MNHVKKPTDGENKGPGFEECAPLSVREARLARACRDKLWPYVWMNLVSTILLFGAAVVMAYRMGAQGCH
jgi:hypothetical protein